jgi:uncharacterized protein (TIGR03086 family)
MRRFVRHVHDEAMTEEHTTVELLIELGRDREAVAAAQESRTNPGGGPMDGVEQLDQIIPTLQALVARITPDQLDAATPCANFTVTGVLEHMIGGASMFAPAFRGEPAAASAAAPAGTPQEQFRAAMTDLLASVHAPGAQERTIASPFGEVPGSMFARYVAFDGLVHGWDLAMATGQAYAPDPAIVAEVDGFVRQLLQPEMRDGDTFAAETEAPADASPLERVIAFSGRRVERSGARS